MKNKVKLYHYSNANIPDKIKVKNFGQNAYTRNDISACNIKRAFYYIGKGKIEHILKYSKYLYIVEVNKNKLYNLDIDKNKLKEKFINKRLGNVNIYNLVKYIKKHYTGAIYNDNVVSVFKDLPYTKKVIRGI